MLVVSWPALPIFLIMRKKFAQIVLAGLFATALSACSTLEKGPVGNAAVPQPAKSVELDRYLGRWYELARYEAGFQKGCEGVTADYSFDGPSKIKVVNSCRKRSLDGKADQAIGKAKIVEGSNNAKLRVSFFGPFYGDYWVLDRDEDYQWAIVGEPSGRYLWLLHRQANPGEKAYQAMRNRAAALGYDTALLRRTKQPG
jgi:apolipoprotein D and lipocalin family protein